jgi:hypothetical protein
MSHVVDGRSAATSRSPQDPRSTPGAADWTLSIATPSSPTIDQKRHEHEAHWAAAHRHHDSDGAAPTVRSPTGRDGGS